MSEAFFDFVRGRSDVVPAGYAEAGMRAYRHLVWLGACQMVDASFPQLREQLVARGGAWTVLAEHYGFPVIDSGGTTP